MRTRDGVIQYQKALADVETLIQDINIPDPISAFYIEVECTNGATSNKGNFISDIITKIEVVDGSDVLASLNMAQLEALYFYKTGKTPAMFPSEWAGVAQRHGVHLLFGRYLWDPMYCLVPTKYRNPQLKITTNKAAIRAAGATGFAAGTNILLTLVAKIFEEGASPVGHLMQKQVDSFVSVASGDKRIELPTDYPYRLLMPRFWLQANAIDAIVTDLKLTCDTEKFVPVNRKVKQLDAEALALFGYSRLNHDILSSNTLVSRLLCNKEPRCVLITATATPRAISISAQAASQITIGYFDLAVPTAIAVDENIKGEEEGHALHATLPVVFGRYQEPDTWFDPTKFGKVELVMTQGVAAAVCEIVLEQVRP